MTDFVQLTRLQSIPEEEFYPAMDAMYKQLWQSLLPPQILTDELSSKVANNIVTTSDEPIPNCQECGACCISHPCVGVRPSETLERELYWDVTTSAGGTETIVDRYMRRDGETFACFALKGTLGREVSCSIYDSRPQICRILEPGSDRCHAIRRAFGFEPFLSLDEMSAALERLDNNLPKAEPQQVIRTAQIRPDAATGELVVTVLMKEGALKPLHRYDPARETWMQFEFEGLTLNDAQALIESRLKHA